MLFVGALSLFFSSRDFNGSSVCIGISSYRGESLFTVPRGQLERAWSTNEATPTATLEGAHSAARGSNSDVTGLDIVNQAVVGPIDLSELFRVDALGKLRGSDKVTEHDG